MSDIVSRCAGGQVGGRLSYFLVKWCKGSIQKCGGGGGGGGGGWEEGKIIKNSTPPCQISNVI